MQVSDDAKNFLGGGEGRRVAPSRIFFAQNLLAAALWTQKIFSCRRHLAASSGSLGVRGADRRDKALMPGYSGMKKALTGCFPAGASRPLQPLKQESPQAMKETEDGNRQHLTFACFSTRYAVHLSSDNGIPTSSVFISLQKYVLLSFHHPSRTTPPQQAPNLASRQPPLGRGIHFPKRDFHLHESCQPSYVSGPGDRDSFFAPDASQHSPLWHG